MSAPPGAVWTIDGVRVWGDPIEPNRFVYLPGSPQPQRAPDGSPIGALIVMGGQSILQLGASWGLSEGQDEAIRAALAAPPSGLDRAGLILAMAPLGAVEATLEVADNQGVFAPLARSQTSGYPPFSAVYGVGVEGLTQARAVAALSGHPGALRIAYRADLAGVGVTAVADVASWFAASNSSRGRLSVASG